VSGHVDMKVFMQMIEECQNIDRIRNHMTISGVLKATSS